ncbi:hypothetical protein [Runella limosa]|uniref:hypothetical protein n=1 Tax=Runella limosa TaxID=370978 RepID=UPI00041248CE|nr:hypothetical protein [Runella limosa]
MARNRFFDLILNAGAAIVNLRFPNSATAPSSPYEGQSYYDTATKKFMGWNGTSWVDLSQVITGSVTIKGDITNANTSPAFPSTPATGDIWFITTNAGTVGGIEVEIGDQLVRGTSNWFVIQANTMTASETRAGVIELATQAEANAGTDTTRALTPATLLGYLSNFFYAKRVVQTIASLTANTVTNVTHGLNLATPLVQVWQGGEEIELDVKSVSANAISVTSNTTLANVTVIVIS